MVNTPVLFITFARPDYARMTWDGIRVAKPKTLYFYSNKGRIEIEGEIERNDQIREYIKEIDWDCDLHTWFRDECVNVYDSLRGAIDWLFDNEECGIVLEEDCVPTAAFFSFIDQVADKYRDDTRVWCISGDNYLADISYEYDYYFSHYHWMYGWASWRRVWKSINWDESVINDALSKVNYWQLYKTFKQVLYKKIENRQARNLMLEKQCWDYVFGLFCDLNKGLTICPNDNLITNVGVTGTHHEREEYSVVNKPATNKNCIYVINKHPILIKANKELDRMTFFTVGYRPLRVRFIRVLKRTIKRVCRMWD